MTFGARSPQNGQVEFAERRREIPGWILVPILVFGVGGGFLIYDRAQGQDENRPAMTEKMARADALMKELSGLERGSRLDRDLSAVLNDAKSDPRDRSILSVLSAAVYAGEKVCVRRILSHSSPEVKAEATGTLSAAIQKDDLAMLKLLLAGGVPPQTPRSSVKPRPMNEEDIARSTVGLGYDALFDAISARSLDAIRALLAAGADPDRRRPLARVQIRAIVRGRDAPPEPVPSTAPGRPVPKGDATTTETSPREVAALCGDRAMTALFEGIEPRPQPKTPTEPQRWGE